MATERVPRRMMRGWPILAGLALLAAVGGAYLRWPEPTLPAAPPKTDPAVPAASSPRAAGPTFDVVRVAPDGNGVIAGRAAPGATVTVHDGAKPLGQVQADRNGEFVMIPDRKLASGGRELTLSARGPEGNEVKGEESVVVVVPAAPAPAAAPAPNTPAVAVLLPPGDAAPRVLQAPSDPKGDKLALNTVDYDEKGEIRFAGSAKPSSPVRVYVDNKPAGEANADAKGQWTLTPPDSVAPDTHQFRVDQLASNGRVVGRVELPFQRVANADPATQGPGQTVVQPGQNLWRIARSSYGNGMRYTVIFLANRDHIRDPNLIYPGQVFAIPASAR